MRVGIVAGEASGDLLGALLISALKTHFPAIKVYGLGGPQMISAGFESLFAMDRLSVMGLFEPLLHLPDLFRLRKSLYRHFIRHPPDVFIGIDSPEFNLGLELKLRKAQIKTVHYVSPSVWAWRRSRIHKIRKAVDLMLTLFPFEMQFYKEQEVPACYVGHPLADKIPLVIDQMGARRALGLDPSGTYIALLPGSRRQEIRYMGKTFLQAAVSTHLQQRELKFLSSSVSDARHQEFHAIYQQVSPELPFNFFINRTHEVIAASDVVLVTAGTATLEVMLHKKPMVVAYRMSALAYRLAKWLVKVPYISLPNLLLQDQFVPELIQQDANPANIASHLLTYLQQRDMVHTIQDTFSAIHERLRMNSAKRAAQAILDLAAK